MLLSVDHPEDYDRYSPMVSRLLHLTVIDILTTGVALRLGPDLRPDAPGHQAQPAREALHGALSASGRLQAGEAAMPSSPATP